jgi:hypothetical protein
MAELPHSDVDGWARNAPAPIAALTGRILLRSNAGASGPGFGASGRISASRRARAHAGPFDELRRAEHAGSNASFQKLSGAVPNLLTREYATLMEGDHD